ncbi:hypothetical protein MD484_g7760, partial [Candolleomyces efflorescens]
MVPFSSFVLLSLIGAAFGIGNDWNEPCLDGCGKNAFAHISRAWVPQDQTIPEGVASRLVKRDGTLPEVQALHIDTDFAAVDTEGLDDVYFAIQAANIPGAEDLVLPSSSRIKGRDESTFVDDAVYSVSRLFDFEWDYTKNIKIVDINKTWNIFDQQLTCPNYSGRLRMDVSAQVNAAAAIGVAVEGKLIPPKITDFALIAALNANLNGALNLNGGLTGSIGTGNVKLYEVGVPGLSFPGGVTRILTIGPTFRIDASAVASLDVNADLTVGINYAIEQASMVYPPTSKHAIKNGGTFKFIDTPLKLSAVPSVSANGRVEAHLIPSLNMGVNALSGAAKASVFLNVDASAQMNLALQGQASGEIIVGREETRELSEVAPVIEVDAQPLEVRAPTPVDVAPRATATGSASFAGCFDIGAGLDINVGASAKFFSLFDQSVQYALFSRDWELYKKCFGAQTKRREISRLDSYTWARSIDAPVTLSKRLVCPSLNLPPLQPLVDSMVMAASVKQL